MSQLQDSILSAISTLTSTQVDSMTVDKTVVATVASSTNTITGEYSLEYGGGFITAYAQNGASYKANTSVYVLIPQNDMTKEKIILGRANVGNSSDSNITYASSIASDYNMIGNNAIKLITDPFSIGLRSYLQPDRQILYQRGSNKNLIDVDHLNLLNSIKTAEAIQIEASFQTSLSKDHKKSTNGSYGLEFVLAFKDGNNVESEFNLYLGDMINTSIQNEKAWELREQAATHQVVKYYRNQIEEIWNSGLIFGLKDEHIKTFLKDLSTYSSVLQEPQKKLVDEFLSAANAISTLDTEDAKKEAYQVLLYQYRDLGEPYQVVQDYLDNPTNASWKNTYLNYLNLYLELFKEEGNYSLVDLCNRSIVLVQNNNLEELNKNTVPKIKYNRYVLDMGSMNGNPYNFISWTDQYALFFIDPADFLYIENITAFCKDFEEVSNELLADDLHYGKDIFIKDIEFYAAKKIGAVNGDYRLAIQMPQGSTFTTRQSSDTKEILGILTYQGEDISGQAQYFWFRKDVRIKPGDEAYHFHGKSGWYYLQSKANRYDFDTTAAENTAYANEYLCVAVYKETIILKDTFVVYNEANRRDISIVSDMGNTFSGDRGNPTLTCLVNGLPQNFDSNIEDVASRNTDNQYLFYWSKTNRDGTVVSFTQTYDELRAEYDEAIASGEFTSTELLALKSQMQEVENVKRERNQLIEYPVNKIDQSATFGCSVFLADINTNGKIIEDSAVNIGSAEITLTNDTSTKVTDYSIVIVGGNQVFQYNEAGVSPADTRYADPQTVEPLTCRFYDPAGYEVNTDLYSVRWTVPIEQTMVVAPEYGMTQNPVNGKLEYWDNPEFPLQIASSYDYSAANNQLGILVTYKGREYKGFTNLLFTKVGENGTNGTDIVVKISPINETIAGKEPLVLINKKLDNNKEETYWNTGQVLTEPVLKFELFSRSLKIANENLNIKWKMAGGGTSQTKCFSITATEGSQTSLSWVNDTSQKKYRNQIVRGECTFEDNSYYGFYPIPVIRYLKENLDYKVVIDYNSLLKSITYNNDGRNPLYNKNQGIKLTLFAIDSEEKILYNEFDEPRLVSKAITWSALGGENETEDSILRLSFVQDTNYAECSINLVEENSEENPVTSNEHMIYITPSDIYGGALVNHMVKATVVDEFEIYIPILTTLNTYGLKSLNAWDGISVEINEDDNYIMAPQIGAGIKDDNNKFTGVVMGTAQTYHENNPKVGLLGYSQGRQSIYLDAATGQAIFGIPEDEATKENDYMQGRIKLVPNGMSEIGSWKINNNALFNIPNLKSRDAEDNLNNTYYTSIEINGKPTDQLKASAVKKYEDLSSKYKMSIPHNLSGILLSADPSYISVKSNTFTEQTDNKGIDFTGANSTVQLHDSFEIQLDPEDKAGSIFTLYRHTASPETKGFEVVQNGSTWQIRNKKTTSIIYATRSGTSKKTWTWNPTDNKVDGQYLVALPVAPNSITNWFDKNTLWKFYLIEKKEAFNIYNATKDPSSLFKWRRESKVGIDSQGRFYTNALKETSTSLIIGNIGAFGASADDLEYNGAAFEVGPANNSKSLLKIFASAADINDSNKIKTTTLYLSGAHDSNNEYSRPISIHGKTISLYSSEDGSSTNTTNHKLLLTDDSAIFGHDQVYLTMNNSHNFTMHTPNNDWTTGKTYSQIKAENLNIKSYQSYLTLYNDSEHQSLLHAGKDLKVSANGNLRLLTPNVKTEMSSDKIESTVKETDNIYSLYEMTPTTFGLSCYSNAKNKKRDYAIETSTAITGWTGSAWKSDKGINIHPGIGTSWIDASSAIRADKFYFRNFSWNDDWPDPGSLSRADYMSLEYILRKMYRVLMSSIGNCYTKSEVDNLLAGKSNTGHTHNYASSSHTHNLDCGGYFARSWDWDTTSVVTHLSDDIFDKITYGTAVTGLAIEGILANGITTGVPN